MMLPAIRTALVAAFVASSLAACSGAVTTQSVVPYRAAALQSLRGDPALATCQKAENGSGILSTATSRSRATPVRGRESRSAPRSRRTGSSVAYDRLLRQDRRVARAGGLCSVDLDGSGPEGVGGIEHAPVPTTVGVP